MTKRALVLGAGGHAASAWEIGVALGLAEAGVEIRTADVLIGTSAGARVAAQLASDVSLEALFVHQAEVDVAEWAPEMDFKQWSGKVAELKKAGGAPSEILQRMGAWAMRGGSESGQIRRRSVEQQLPSADWPERRVLIAAVDAERGERRVFDRQSGARLVDAVGASGALAGVWPPVAIDGRHYIDGGFYSSDNADLAAGCDEVLVLALKPAGAQLSLVGLDEAVAALHKGGAQVEVVHPDKATEAAFAAAGGNVLDPKVRPAAAEAGREQGHRMASQAALKRSA